MLLATFAKKIMKKLLYFSLMSLGFMALGSCSLNNVSVDNHLEKYFTANHLRGSFALLDNVHETFKVYNLAQYKDSAYNPGNSFDILTSLVALETGAVTDENSLIQRKNDSSWTLSRAFKTDDTASFISLTDSIGQKTMQFWMDSLHYGNKRITASEAAFWQNDSLRITPDEQLGFTEKVYFAQFPFQKRVQRLVKELMTQESNTLYNLSYKATWQTDKDGRGSGWVLGWEEENKRVYFFTLHAEALDSQADKTALVNTLKAILTDEGFFQGKK